MWEEKLEKYYVFTDINGGRVNGDEMVIKGAKQNCHERGQGKKKLE